MADITIKFRDGTERHFAHEARLGGSYTKRVTFENGVVTITDEWYRKTSFPLDRVAEVIEIPNR